MNHLRLALRAIPAIFFIEIAILFRRDFNYVEITFFINSIFIDLITFEQKGVLAESSFGAPPSIPSTHALSL